MHQDANEWAGLGGAEFETDQRGQKIQQLKTDEDLYDSHVAAHLNNIGAFRITSVAAIASKKPGIWYHLYGLYGLFQYKEARLAASAKDH